MAQMKQCPQCGKYVAADRTYCMNCGITLGIRCPDCRTVLPVGSKTCTACGHSFVKKKKKLAFPLWDWMKKNAKPLVVGLSLLCLLLTLVLAAFVFVILLVAIAMAALGLWLHTEAGVWLDAEGDLRLGSAILFMAVIS
ncbi:MAG: zinc ribbon domain-containing protein, partial [Clostridia bacterium]|nr:zinc ribbon domain-containing protein [Clostridia bacterium]